MLSSEVNVTNTLVELVAPNANHAITVLGLVINAKGASADRLLTLYSATGTGDGSPTPIAGPWLIPASVKANQSIPWTELNNAFVEKSSPALGVYAKLDGAESGTVSCHVDYELAASKVLR